MSDTFRSAGSVFAAVVAGITPMAAAETPDIARAADAMMAAREAEADAIAAAAATFEAAEPFAEPVARPSQPGLFD